jgi:hypothetical protein
MKNRVETLAVVAALLAAAAGARAEDPAQALSRGKLEADLGHHAAAAAAFESVTRAAQASPEQRWEALVRLGVARREAGDPVRSVDAFEGVWRGYRQEPEALRLLLQAVGSALPGRERWEQVWRQVTLDVDRKVAGAPVVHVGWPGVKPSLCPCSGNPVRFEFVDADLQVILRMIADVSGLNIVVQPGVQGSATIDVREMPWDEALERMLLPNGFSARRDGNVVWIGRPEDAAPKRKYMGQPIDIDFQDVDLVEVLQQVAAQGGARAEVEAGIAGRVTFKLVQVPWDQVLDLLAVTNGLSWTQTGTLIQVGPRRHP